MIITCEDCSTRFALDESLIRPEGSKVRCSKCQHVFLAMPPGEPEEVLGLETEEDMEFHVPDDDFSQDFLGDDQAAVDFETDAPGEDDGSGEDEQGIESQSPEEIDFGTEFDTVDFDHELDFDETDLTFEAPEDVSDFQTEEIDFDASELSFDESPETSESGEAETPSGEMDIPSLEMEEPDQAAGAAEIDELTFEDFELQDASPSSDADGADIEISFDEDETPQELMGLSLEMESGDTDEVEFTTEELEFESDADQDLDGSMEMESTDPDSLETIEDTRSQPDLELSFEETPDLEEIEFDDPGTGDEEPAIDDKDMPGFPEIEDFQLDGDTDDAGPELDLSDLDATGFDPSLEDQKFAEYDQVLDQDTEPEEDFPELDEELNDPAVSPPEDAPVQAASSPEQATDPEGDEMDAAGPLIDPMPGRDGGKRRRKKKQGLGAPVKILVLLFLLVIAAYLISLRLGISIPFLDQVNIPFVTQAFKPAPPPVAATGPIPNDASTKGRFVTNATAGRLFIVTGQVDNPDKTAYSQIRVRGTLLTKGNKKAATQVIYCGNVISEEELKSGNISDITKQLNASQGIQNTNINIKPGGSVRFMLVFSNLPENLTNFTVEVLDYKPAGPQ